METRSNHMLVGAIVLGLLGALLLFIVWLSQMTGDAQKRYDIFFQQSVEGLAKGSAVTFSGVPVGQVESINLEPENPQFIRVRISVRQDTPVLQGTTATIRGVGFTGVSQIQLDPPEPAPAGQPPVRREEIVCPEPNPEAECPYGVPVIPTRPGALGQLLNTAPELLERVSTLTERLTEVLSDRNQESIAGILANTEELTRSLAERGPEIAATMAEARVAMRQAGEAAERIGQLAGTTEGLLDREGRPLINDLRHTIRAAETSMQNLDAAIGDARPGLQAFSNQTLPEVGTLVRDLQATSQSLRTVTERLEQRGVGGVLGGERLPDYRPGRERR
jgi:phospholipid/cholesterol/gamma-HCH transport system substrate-binding protein